MASPSAKPGSSATPQWRPIPNATWVFYVDIVGGCNLACPSCPIGNSRDIRNAKGAMAPNLLDRIVAKAVDECNAVEFSLYNWTEPFLHPELPEMIRRVHKHGVPCSLSTNLNLVRNLDDVLRENPRKIKVSLSGFDPETYAVTHKKGEIDKVKQHMREMAEALERTGSRTRVVVGFHRYLGNHTDEARMEEFVQSLGLEFEPQWAYLMPLEKVLAYASPEDSPTQLTDEDQALVDRLALPLGPALDVVRNEPPSGCQLRDRQMTLTVTGEVMLCCVVYDQSQYAIGSYVDVPLAELQRRKYAHQQCGTCMRNGLHKFFTYEAEALDTLAREHVRSHYPDVELSSLYTPPQNGRRSRLRAVLGRLRRWMTGS